MAGLNINSRQNSMHSSNKKYNVSLLLVIYLVSPFPLFCWLFSSSTVRYTKLFHSNCPRCFSIFHEKTLREERFNVDEANRFQSENAVLARNSNTWLVDVYFFFFIVRSTDWLKLICARSLCMKIYDIAFQWLYLSMYKNKKKNRN